MTELAVVFGVTTVVSAHTPTPVVSGPFVTMPHREVRLVPLSSEAAEIVADEEDSVVRVRVPVKRISDEAKQQRAEARQTREVLRALADAAVDTAEEVHQRAKTSESLTAAESERQPVRKSAATEVLDSGRIPQVPFYSQFADISSPAWQGVGCGIASLAMIIDHYTDEVEAVDELLQRGIAAKAFLDNAGWIHAGLIGLSHDYDLDGESISLSHLSAAAALQALVTELRSGPVMASVHYTFEPTNPIPHLVVITGIKDGLVYYNDPAEATGGGSLPIEKFQRAWKQRYIAIRPA